MLLDKWKSDPPPCTFCLNTDFAVQTKSDLWQRKGSGSPPAWIFQVLVVQNSEWRFLTKWPKDTFDIFGHLVKKLSPRFLKDGLVTRDFSTVDRPFLLCRQNSVKSSWKLMTPLSRQSQHRRLNCRQGTVICDNSSTESVTLFSMFIYMMHGTFAIPVCESTLHKNLTDIQHCLRCLGPVHNRI